jgi:hypothetical protein
MDNLEITLAQPIGGHVRGTISPPPSDKSEIAVLSGQRLTELLEMPVKADGSFDFGHVPSGPYLLNFFPDATGRTFRVVPGRHQRSTAHSVRAATDARRDRGVSSSSEDR